MATARNPKAGHLIKAKPRIQQGYTVTLIPRRRSRDHVFGTEASGSADDRRHDDTGIRNETEAATRAASEQHDDGRSGNIAEPAQLETGAAERQVFMSFMANSYCNEKHQN